MSSACLLVKAIYNGFHNNDCKDYFKYKSQEPAFNKKGFKHQKRKYRKRFKLVCLFSVVLWSCIVHNGLYMGSVRATVKEKVDELTPTIPPMSQAKLYLFASLIVHKIAKHLPSKAKRMANCLSMRLSQRAVSRIMRNRRCGCSCNS